MAPSVAANNVIGAIGGVVLAACLVPQVWRLYKTRSAADISYGYLTMYTLGLVLTFVYLVFEGATVAWACMVVEIAFCVLVMCAKFYLDHWGPYSRRGKLRSSVAAAGEAGTAAGAPGAAALPAGGKHSDDVEAGCTAGSGGSHSVALVADGSARGGNAFARLQAAAQVAGGTPEKLPQAGDSSTSAVLGGDGGSGRAGSAPAASRQVLLLELELPPAPQLPSADLRLSAAGTLDVTAAQAPAAAADPQHLLRVLQAALDQQAGASRIRVAATQHAQR